ncbi:MAG TPA: sugar ABC transporter substrate-binding protein [Rectinemataceae bacterium]|nr:sugar ABC transporter substrate-binding protein [Rectinemataceae bacterium]
MKRTAAIVAMLCMVALGVSGFGQNLTAAQQANLTASLAVDTGVLKSADGQPLLTLNAPSRPCPVRPANPAALPETNPLHWFDMEWAGYNVTPTNIPPSPGDGAIGKRVILIVHGDHPWTTACIKGAQKVADAYKIDLKVLSPNWDKNVQDQMIDQAINERPDMILLIPLDAKGAIQQARKINQAGIPLHIFNTLPSAEALNYSIGWSGPDDWGQFRLLARAWADKLRKDNPGAKTIGVAYVQHAPGGSPYFARSWGPISELSSYAPEIKTLAMASPTPATFDANATMQLVSDWLTRFGKNLKGICAADDSGQALGIMQALKNAGRTDVVVVAAGNSKQGMDLVKQGKLYAITYQTAEGDGALAMQSAADYFDGKVVPARRNLAMRLIYKSNVDEFYPPQW